MTMSRSAIDPTLASAALPGLSGPLDPRLDPLGEPRPDPRRDRRPAAVPGRAARPQRASAGVVSDAAPILAIEDIDLAFGGIQALRGVSMQVKAGEIVSVIGPNGAGKSSLINVVTGLYPPTGGRVRLAGEVFSRVPTARLASLGVARTFQNLALFKGLSVRDNIALGRVGASRAGVAAQVLGFAKARAERRAALAAADELLSFLGLEAVSTRPAGTLPYGLQKRVELARALAGEPRLLLLDEPLAGMTVTEKHAMARLIRAIRDREGMAVVLVEHDIGLVLSLSDRVVVLDHGRRIADGPPDAIRQDQAVIDAYLGTASDEDEDEAKGHDQGDDQGDNQGREQAITARPRLAALKPGEVAETGPAGSVADVTIGRI